MVIMEMSEILTWLVPAPPLISFFVIILFTSRHRSISHLVALFAMGLSLLFSWIIVFNALSTKHFGEHPIAADVGWLPTGDTVLRMGVAVDPLTVVMLTFVPLACFLIILYSVGYSNF